MAENFHINGVGDIDAESEPVLDDKHIRRNTVLDTSMAGGSENELSGHPNVIEPASSVIETETTPNCGDITNIDTNVHHEGNKECSVHSGDIAISETPNDSCDLKTSLPPDGRSETDLGVQDISARNKLNNNSKTLSSNWKHQKKQGGEIAGGQTLLITKNKPDTAARKQSLTVPTSGSDDTKLSADKQSESDATFVRESSKLSLLSSISQRSGQIKTDYTTVQMPTDEKRFEPLQEDSWIRQATPYLPLWVAVLCLLLNILVSGSGTILSGLCIFCCAKSRVPPKYDPDPILIFCVNVWVGLAQLFTVTFLLVGWFWSLAWGIRMVILSLESRREQQSQRAKQLQEMAMNAFGNHFQHRKSIAMGTGTM